MSHRNAANAVSNGTDLSTPLGMLNDGDIILLLTPAIVPEASPLNRNPDEPPLDPFEPLGKALARYHPWVRHVPYVPQNGITDTHKAHIKLAAAVIFVISGPPRHGQRSQVDLAQTVGALSKHPLQVILTCCDAYRLDPLEELFPTVVEVPSLDPSHLEAAAGALLRQLDVNCLVPSRGAWSVEVWDGNSDISAVVELWCQCFPEVFHLSQDQLGALLRRDGYAMHYVVREPETSLILGFCATYTTYADSDNERLLGSLAALLVRPSFQGRGIGRILHNHALRQLTKTRGVYLLQLGSTFPRLLYGLPADSPSEVKDWFRRRGWPIPLTAPGSTHEACDWFLEFKNWPAANWLPSSFTFRPCEVTEIDTVIDFVKGESSSEAKPGFYDQYTKLADHKEHIPDIVLGLEGKTIIAAALTYYKKAGSPVAEDLPWADVIADDVGGVTCVCIRDGVQLDTVLTGLLHSCICALKRQGANKLLVDAVKWGHEGFHILGFQKWVTYTEVWRDATTS